jgi:hypothetical protein
MTDKAIVELTKEDCHNITSWWVAATMMAEARLRVIIADSERETIKKISDAERRLRG